MEPLKISRDAVMIANISGHRFILAAPRMQERDIVEVVEVLVAGTVDGVSDFLHRKKWPKGFRPPEMGRYRLGPKIGGVAKRDMELIDKKIVMDVNCLAPIAWGSAD